MNHGNTTSTAALKQVFSILDVTQAGGGEILLTGLVTGLASSLWVDVGRDLCFDGRIVGSGVHHQLKT